MCLKEGVLSSAFQKPRGDQGAPPTFPCCRDGVCLGGMSPCWCVGKQMLKQLLRAEHIIPVKCNENLARGLNLFKSNHLQGIFEAGCQMKPALTFFSPVHGARSSKRTPSTGLRYWYLDLNPICAMNVLCDLTQVTLSVFVHGLDNGTIGAGLHVQNKP